MTNIQLQSLEARQVPSGLSWPIPSYNISRIMSVYGEYQESGGIHFHEGVDVVVNDPLGKSNVPVTAIEAGTVFGVYIDIVQPQYSYISIKSGNHVWNYVHISPTKADGTFWSKGDTVAAGEQLGKVIILGKSPVGSVRQVAHIRFRQA